MSLEKQIETLTAAVTALTEVTNNLLSVRVDAIETVKNSAAPAAKKAEPKAAAKAEPKTEPAAEAPAPAADDSAYAEAKKLVGEYTTGSDRPEEVDARKQKVKGLLRHEKLVKPDLAEPEKFSVTDVQEAQIPVLIKNLKALIERGDITTPPTDDDLV